MSWLNVGPRFRPHSFSRKRAVSHGRENSKAPSCDPTRRVCTPRSEHNGRHRRNIHKQPLICSLRTTGHGHVLTGTVVAYRQIAAVHQSAFALVISESRDTQ